MKIAHDVYIDAICNKWEKWREHYDVLTIDDLIWLNTALNDYYGFASRFSLNDIDSVFGLIINSDKVKTIRVVELGCFRGFLARAMLDLRPEIKNWIGYDINFHSIRESVVKDSRYLGIKLSEWFFDIQIPPCNVFVSSHTLEHMNENQVGLTVRAIYKSGIEYAIVEVPFDRGNRKWHGYNGSHVYEGSPREFCDLFEAWGYQKFIEFPNHVFGFKQKGNKK